MATSETLKWLVTSDTSRACDDLAALGEAARRGAHLASLPPLKRRWLAKRKHNKPR